MHDVALVWRTSKHFIVCLLLFAADDTTNRRAQDARVTRVSERKLEDKAKEKEAQLAPQLELGSLIPAMFSGKLVSVFAVLGTTTSKLVAAAAAAAVGAIE